MCKEKQKEECLNQQANKDYFKIERLHGEVYVSEIAKKLNEVITRINMDEIEKVSKCANLELEGNYLRCTKCNQSFKY